MTTIGMSHNALYVKDLDKSVHFYRDLLGMKLTHEQTEGTGEGRRRAAYLRWDDEPSAFVLVIAQYLGQRPEEPPTGVRTAMDHFAFYVDDMQQLYERLTAEGIKCSSAPREIDFELFGGPRGSRVLSMFCDDPDGLPVQFEQLIAG